MLSRPVVGAVLVILLCVGFQAYRINALAKDCYALEKGTQPWAPLPPPAGPGSSWPVPQNYSLDLSTGLIPTNPTYTEPHLYALIDASAKNPRTFFAAEEGLQRYLSTMPSSERFLMALEARLSGALASMPANASAPPKVIALAPRPNYREALDTGRLWCLLAWEAARKGEAHSALLAACGPALLALNLEMSESRIAGLTPNGKRVSGELRRMSGLALAALAPVIRPTKGQVLSLLEWATLIERSSQGMDQVYLTAKKFLPALGEELKQLIAHGGATRIFGHNPHSLQRLLENRVLIDSYQDPILGSFLAACPAPYPAAIKQVDLAQSRLETLQQRGLDLGWRLFGLLFQPERYHLEQVLTASLPDLRQYFISEIAAQAMFRGGVATVMIEAFYQEVGAWPGSGDDLEAWFNGWPLPADPFTGAPLNYRPGRRPTLSSPGPDQIPGTTDDLDFLPRR